MMGMGRGDRDWGPPRRGDHIHIAARQDPAFLEHRRPELQAVGENSAFRLGDRDLTEPHAASARSPRRRIWVICATIEIATSAGETAPMANPIGPWMRASSVSPKPSSVS